MCLFRKDVTGAVFAGHEIHCTAQPTPIYKRSPTDLHAPRHNDHRRLTDARSSFLPLGLRTAYPPYAPRQRETKPQTGTSIKIENTRFLIQGPFLPSDRPPRNPIVYLPKQPQATKATLSLSPLSPLLPHEHTRSSQQKTPTISSAVYQKAAVAPAPNHQEMSTFITSLWDSIFTPGPTAPLLYATNLSFAALQLVLL
ncbi:hypothetical protein E4U11_006432, partial [Claviceps purpurea]